MKLRLTSSAKIRVRPGASPSCALAGSAATSITIDEPVDKDGRIIQFSNGGTTATLTISGTYTGSPSAIEVCTVRKSNGVPVLSWVTLAVNPTGGVFSGTVAVPRGPFQVLGRVRCSVNSAVTATSTRSFAVGIMIVLAGQSNMRFLSEASVNYLLANLNGRRYRYTVDQWQHHGNYDPTEAFQPGTPSNTYASSYTAVTPDRGDGIVTFANAMADALGYAVGTIECSVVSTLAASWTPPSGANWINLETALAESGGDAMLWLYLQGESDASSGTTAGAWQLAVEAMFARAQALTGRSASQLHWGVGILGTATTYATEGRFGVIRAAQLATLAANPTMFTMGAFIEAPIGDSVHYLNTYRPRMGRVMSHLCVAKIAGSPKSTPYITGASRSGAVVTFPIAGNIGALKDGAGGAGGSLQGFRVFDNGVLATQASTAISGNNVVVTLSAVPAGPVTADFGMANAPFGSTPAASSILYDSDTVVNDTLGMTLLPKALFTVTGG